MKRIELPRPVALSLLHEALVAGEQEACGLLSADTNGDLRVIPVKNAAAEPRRRFEMDERELVDAMKGLRERGESLYAIWHSHPDAAAEPSSTDIARSQHRDVLHLIISLEIRGVLQMRGWNLSGATPEPVDVGIAEEA